MKFVPFCMIVLGTLGALSPSQAGETRIRDACANIAMVYNFGGYDCWPGYLRSSATTQVHVYYSCSGQGRTWSMWTQMGRCVTHHYH